jgi:hypothetical protein
VDTTDGEGGGFVPVERITRHADRFRCEPMRATIKAETCLRRRAAALNTQSLRYEVVTDDADLTPCLKCPIGPRVAERLATSRSQGPLERARARARAYLSPWSPTETELDVFTHAIAGALSARNLSRALGLPYSLVRETARELIARTNHRSLAHMVQHATHETPPPNASAEASGASAKPARCARPGCGRTESKPSDPDDPDFRGLCSYHQRGIKTARSLTGRARRAGGAGGPPPPPAAETAPPPPERGPVGDLLEEARAHLAEREGLSRRIKSRILALGVEVNELSGVLRAIDAGGGAAPANDAEPEPEVAAPEPAPKPAAKAQDPGTLAERVLAALGEAGRPMRILELVTAVNARKPKAAYASVSSVVTRLYRQQRVVCEGPSKKYTYRLAATRA